MKAEERVFREQADKARPETERARLEAERANALALGDIIETTSSTTLRD